MDLDVVYSIGRGGGTPFTFIPSLYSSPLYLPPLSSILLLLPPHHSPLVLSPSSLFMTIREESLLYPYVLPILMYFPILTHKQLIHMLSFPLETVLHRYCVSIKENWITTTTKQTSTKVIILQPNLKTKNFIWNKGKLLCNSVLKRFNNHKYTITWQENFYI